MINITIFDLDGTLYDDRERRALLPNTDLDKPSSFAAYHEASVNDKFYPVIVKILQNIHMNGGVLIKFVTGRPEQYREMTLSKLSKELGYNVSSDDLSMRPDDDAREVHLFKRDVFSLLKNNYTVRSIYDDNALNLLEAMKLFPADCLFVLLQNGHIDNDKGGKI